ncbi:GDP-L-fucose synthase family protein [Thermosipho sp. 1070]|uniref:GDP-L-fucose synthase family protein n=1 Tax=Thermosipho sp. 1070 TaxID=1437364 RepID=UPI0009492D0F|nr:GDP-L-fucose synthase [Thermosipho sp. 1070]ANQ53648.1 GDP-L-fucose synthase [Thermosipho sp. 1070]
MKKHSKIYVAGHRGLVGSAIVRKLKELGYTNIITKTHAELDLTNQKATREFFEKERPEYVFLAAAKVGGIEANTKYPVEFLYENTMIQNNVIKCSYDFGVKRLLFFSSANIYPENCPQPMKEDYLFSGKLEASTEGYALAKLVGLKLCEYYNREYNTNFLCIIPSNVYGPGDKFYSDEAHVIPALITKFYEAKTNNEPYVKVWGSGKAKREFLYVEDLADAAIFLMKNTQKIGYINVGSGYDISIEELASMLKTIIGYTGNVEFDTAMPEGVLQKLLDVSKIHNLGWKCKVELKEGLIKTYKWFLENYHKKGG